MPIGPNGHALCAACLPATFLEHFPASCRIGRIPFVEMARGSNGPPHTGEEVAMSTTFATTTTTTTATTEAPARTTRARALWAAGLVSGAAAAITTTVVAAVARAADAPLAIDGEQIPLFGFAQLTMMCAVIGTVLAVSLAKWARRPQRTFLVTTVALTVLSLVPDVVADATTGSKLVLMFTHLVAAAIVVPTLAKRLPA